MMTIHDFQMAVFARVHAARFEDDVVRHLRKCYSAARQLPRATIRAFVRAQVVKAQGYGLASERHLATYVDTAWQLGGDFDDRFPVLGRMLRLPPAFTDPERKARFLVDHTRELFAVMARHAP